MSNEITTLASAINTEHRKAQECAQAAIDHAYEAGRLLVEAKATVPHGDWGAWLAANFEGSERTARGYMRLANNWEAITAKRQSSADLSIDGALQLLAAPKDKPAPDWLPTDPDVLAKLVFKHTVPGISHEDGEPAQPEHPRLFVQRMGKNDPHWKYEEETPRYFAIFMEGSQVSYTKCPQTARIVAYSIGMFAGGRFTKVDKMVQALELKHDDDSALRAHADLGWEYSEASPEFVSSLVDILHPFDPMEW